MTSAAIFRGPESRSAIILSPTIAAHSLSLALSPLFSLAFYNPITAKNYIIDRTIDHYLSIIYPQAKHHAIRQDISRARQREAEAIRRMQISIGIDPDHATTPRQLVSPNYQNRTAVADAFAAAGLGGSPLAPAAAKLVQIHPRLRAPPIACPIIPIFHRQELGHQPEQPSAPTTAIISSIATNNIQLCLRTTPPSPTNASLNS